MKHDSIETYTFHGYTIHILQDYDPMSPREWGNLGTMACWHRRYDLGDIQPQDDPQTHLADVKPALTLPLYLYDHSGITMRTTPFSCPWDSGQVGVIYVTREKLLKEYGGKRLTKKVLEKATKVLVGEVETYDQYIRGDVYGFVIEDQDGEQVESVWGFFGMESAKEEAEAVVKGAVERDRKMGTAEDVH